MVSGGYKSASISDVPLFDNKMSSLFLKRDTSVNDIHQNNSYTLHYRRQRNGEIAFRKSASISVTGDATASFNPAWTGSGTFTVVMQVYQVVVYQVYGVHQII